MSHNCDDSLEKLYLYLDSELDKANTEHIRTHLEECTDCFVSFDFEKRLKRVVHDRLQEKVPSHLLDKIKTAINEAETHSPGAII